MRYLLFVFMISILGCSTSVKHYAGSGPELKLEQFFNGRLTAYGMVQDRNGKVLRRFRVDMLGTWEDGKGKLDEQFTYDDGKQEQRIWHLEKTADGRYTGHADDVVVPARGETGGYALNWHYQLSIPVDGENWAISFNDWMYLIDENRMINRAEMSKWGFKVGEVTLWIEKHS